MYQQKLIVHITAAMHPCMDTCCAECCVLVCLPVNQVVMCQFFCSQGVYVVTLLVDILFCAQELTNDRLVSEADLARLWARCATCKA
jgi:hypothetical protein